jgi:hypothetical protein
VYCSPTRVCMGSMTCGMALSAEAFHKLRLGIFRSKRCQLIRDLRWQGRFLPEHVRQQLSPPELQVQSALLDTYTRFPFAAVVHKAHTTSQRLLV